MLMLLFCEVKIKMHVTYTEWILTVFLSLPFIKLPWLERRVFPSLQNSKQKISWKDREWNIIKYRFQYRWWDCSHIEGKIGAKLKLC